MVTESDIRRIIREELALALHMSRSAEHPASSPPTPALNAVREMSRREQIDAMARNPALAKEMFKRSRKPARSRKAAA